MGSGLFPTKFSNVGKLGLVSSYRLLARVPVYGRDKVKVVFPGE